MELFVVNRRYAPPITAAMVSKCLGQRPTTVKAATDCCLALTELEAAETVVVRAGCV